MNEFLGSFVKTCFVSFEIFVFQSFLLERGDVFFEGMIEVDGGKMMFFEFGHVEVKLAENTSLGNGFLDPG